MYDLQFLQNLIQFISLVDELIDFGIQKLYLLFPLCVMLLLFVFLPDVCDIPVSKQLA